jgi:hypothetical protein
MAKGDNNYIKRLEDENKALRAQLLEARDAIIEDQLYLLSSKFQGPDNDYVHIRTDMLPKLCKLLAIVG